MTELRTALFDALQSIYQLPAFAALEDMIQGETLLLQYLSFHQQETVCPSDLSDALRLSRSRITGAITSLRKKGLVRSCHSETDRRRVEVSITEKGLDQIQEKRLRLDRYFDKMLAGLGEADARALIALIQKCEEVMR